MELVTVGLNDNQSQALVTGEWIENDTTEGSALAETQMGDLILGDQLGNFYRISLIVSIACGGGVQHHSPSSRAI